MKENMNIENTDLRSNIDTGQDGGNVKVVCRFRPINNSEQEKSGNQIICDFEHNGKSVTITTSKNVGSGLVGTNKFIFDRVFDMNTSQRDVYEQSAKSIIEGVLKGFNGTVFAYGQTGSGKTHTMQGTDIDDLEKQGIVPRMVRTVFNKIDNMRENVEFTVKVSMCEIYMEKIRDLLDPTKIDLKIKENKENGVYIKDITERYIASDEEVYDIMRIGNEHRKTSCTAMNDVSSRSHSIFMMTISQNNLDDFSSRKGTLYLVDLAGSEKVAKTHVTHQQLDEAKGINKSLSTLGKVIHSLTDSKSTHIPYRDSKLTRILTESLGGNAKTCLIITCSPSPYNELETMSTLRFGTAARNIKNKPKINKEYTVPELKLMVAKRDQLIIALRKRIQFLEEFIKENGLKVPSDEFLANLTTKLQNDAEDPIGQEDTPKFDLSPEFGKLKEDEEAESDDEELKEESHEIAFDEEADLTEPNDFNQNETTEGVSPEDIEQQNEAKRIVQLVEQSNSQNKQNQKEIIHKFLDLQEQLREERENNQTQLDVLSNLKEDYEVVKVKLQKYQDEKEEFNKFKEAIDQKIAHYKDKAQESENNSTVFEAKLKTVENELIDLKKLFAIAKTKIERYEEKGAEFIIEEAKNSKEFVKQMIDNNEVIREEVIKSNEKQNKNEAIISEELIVLHNQIKEKDELIAKIQNLPELEDKIKIMIQESDEKTFKLIQDNNQKKPNSIMKKVILGDADIDVKGVKEPLYLTPEEAVELALKQADLRHSLRKAKKSKKKLQHELEKLKKSMSNSKNIDGNDLEAIANALAEDKIQEINEKHDEERKEMLNNLADRIEKVCELRVQIDALQEENKRLEMLLNGGDYTIQQQINYFEKQIETLTMMYHQSSSECSVIKVDLQVSEKKNKSKDKKIDLLEKKVNEIREQRDKIEAIAKRLKAAVENDKFSNPNIGPNNLTGIPSHGKIVKRLKAGNGRATVVNN